MPGSDGKPENPSEAPASSDAEQADEANGVVLHMHAWVIDHWPTTLRQAVGYVIVLVAATVGTIAAARLVAATADELNLVAYIGLAATCWVGAGGAMVPIPGVRPLSWVMIVHQGAVLSPVIVIIVAAVAMAVGQTSLFVAARAGSRHHRAGGHRHLPRGRHAEGQQPADEEASPSRLETARQHVSNAIRSHPARSVFVASIVPNPLTSVASTVAGATGLRFESFFLASLGGFLIFSLALVILGNGLLALFGLSAD